MRTNFLTQQLKSSSKTYYAEPILFLFLSWGLLFGFFFFGNISLFPYPYAFNELNALP